MFITSRRFGKVLSLQYSVMVAVSVIVAGAGFILARQALVQAAPQTFVVTNANPSGDFSLSWAIEQANNNDNPLEQDRIEFDIAETNAVTITPASQLTITEPVIIDGYTQADATPNSQLAPNPFDGVLRVELDVSEAGALTVTSDNVTLQGLAINNGAEGNVTVDDVTNFKLFGSYLDTKLDGLTPNKTASSTHSLQLNDTRQTQIGGALATERNLFANCSINCVQVTGQATDQVAIKGNYIGLGSDGLTSLDNYAVSGKGGIGVEVLAGSNITIGGSSAAEGNSLERNNWGAIAVLDSSQVRVLGNRVIFNRISDLHAASPYGDAGIFFGGVTDGQIGSSEGGRNIISGNEQGGISVANSTITDAASSDIQIENNYLGVMDDGQTVFANKLRSIDVAGSSSKVTIAGNIIRGATGDDVFSGAGVSIRDAAELVSVLNNSIFDNYGLGIEVTATSNTPAPMYSSTTEADGNTSIEYSLIGEAGQYHIEFFENDQLDGSGMGEGQRLIGQQEITKTGGGHQQFSKVLTGVGHSNIALTATRYDPEGINGLGQTSQFGGLRRHADLAFTMSSGGYVAETATDHQITQTITNLGPDSVTAIDFDLSTSDCFSTNTTSTGGTASNTGTYNNDSNMWNGSLDSGQSLTITFTGAVTCSAGDAVVFTHSMLRARYNSVEVVDVNGGNNNYMSITAIVVPVDLQFATTDGMDSVLTTETDHRITQTITNLSSQSLSNLQFTTLNIACISLDTISLSGSATNVGTYDPDTREWVGELAPNQTLILTFTTTLTCGAGGNLSLEHALSSINGSDDLQDLNLANNDYADSTVIKLPVTDFGLTLELDNRQDLAIGSELTYTARFTNHGPQPFDISIFDGSVFGANQLFTGLLPGELDYLDFNSEDGLACDSFGPSSADGFGSAMANHPNFTAVNCYDTTGSERILAAGDSVEVQIKVKPNNTSDLTFVSYALGNFGPYDADGEVLADLGSNDIIDFLLEHPVNNFAIGLPAVDIGIQKNLVSPTHVKAGGTISYDITLKNRGPMDIAFSDLTLAAPLFADIYPGADLTFIDDSSDNVVCQDLGAGSAAYIGAGGSAHPSHQLLICLVTNPDLTISAGEKYTVRLNFAVNNSASASFTNYVSASALSSDPDAVAINAAFATATSDILDSIVNDNFAKVTYTNPDLDDDDNDGVPNGIENTGPNKGDANNDGIADRGQPDVASFISLLTNKRVVLTVADKRCRVASKEIFRESDIGQQDQDYDYPIGLMSFTLQCDKPGITTRISQIYYDEVIKSYVVRKYNPNTQTYNTIDRPSMGNPVIDGKNAVSFGYQLVDGGDMDMDGVKNGTIVDPAGLAKKATVGAKVSNSIEENPFVIIAAGILTGLTIVICASKVLQKDEHTPHIYRPKNI